MNPHKTYKREVAVALLAYYIGMSIASIWVPEAGQAAEAAKLSVFTFATAAFALDAGAKQYGLGNRGATQ